MEPVAFDEENTVLNKPTSMTADECEALSVCCCQSESGWPVVITCWKLTKEELEEVNRTGRVYLVVVGDTMPPVKLHGTKPFINTQQVD